MSWKIVGYGPKSSVVPHIPDFILVSDGESLRCILKIDPRTGSEQPVPGPYESLDGTYLFHDNMWIAVEEDGVKEFLASQEAEWRSKRAQQLAQEAVGMRGDPARTLRLVEAAGRLQGFDVPGLVRRLQASKQSPDEELEDVLKRVRKG